MQCGVSGKCLRADEGWHSQHLPQGRDGRHCDIVATVGAVPPWGCSLARKENKSLDNGSGFTVWAELHTSLPLWKGQRCKRFSLRVGGWHVLKVYSRPGDQKAKSAAQVTDVAASVCLRYYFIRVGAWEQYSPETQAHTHQDLIICHLQLRNVTKGRERGAKWKMKDPRSFTNPH